MNRKVLPKSSWATLFVAVYSLIAGVGILFLAGRWDLISYFPEDLVWVRISGMLILCLSYFHFVLFKNPQRRLFWGSIASQVLFAGLLLYLLPRINTVLNAFMIVVGTGLLLCVVMFFLSPQSVSAPFLKMPGTAFWNLYVSGYTFMFGVLLFLLPDTPILGWMGFPQPQGLWVRVAGLCFFSLSIYNLIVFYEKGSIEAIRAILNFRIGIVLTLLILVVTGHPPFLLVVALIVSVGIAGTLRNYKSEVKEAMSSGPKVRGNHA